MSAKRAFVVLSVVAFTASLAWGTGSPVQARLPIK